MSDPRLVRRLEAVSYRQRRLARLRWLTGVFVAIAAGCVLLRAVSLPISLWWTLSGLAIVLICGRWLHRARESDERTAAAAIEQRYPELDSRLLTALGQEPSEPGHTYGYLQEQVLSSTVEHARRHPWSEVVPTGRLRAWQTAELAALAASLAAAVWVSRGGSADSTALPADVAGVAGESVTGVVVEPGDTEVERGRSLIVTARFGGEPPSSAMLVTTDAAGSEQRWPLSQSLDDPLFGGRIPEIPSDLTYRVESDAGNSDDFRITTFEYPALLRADAIIRMPEYSGKCGARLHRGRAASQHLSGSTPTLECRFNKPLISAALQPRHGERLAFGPFAPAADTEDDPHDVVAAVTWQPAESQTLELILTDDAGRGLRDPVEFHIEVLPNRPPELTATFPSRDVQVSPLEEVALEATAWDDFGLKEYGVVVRMPDGKEQTIPLGDDTGAAATEQGSEAKLSHLLELEKLSPLARDLLSYSFYADDLDANGAVRRTFGDVFFAEVRHFDEEYRERKGQGGGGGQGAGGQQNPAQQLVDLQRQIVIAAWNSFRAWPAEKVGEQLSKYRDETKVLIESQLAAQEQLAELAAELQDAAAQQHAALADEHMTAAHEQFARAEKEGSVEPLTPARTESQSAYQELLRLRDRLHVVQQAQAGGRGGGGGGGQMDRQLSQLELRNDRNRYETERQAPEARAAQGREQLQALNRLQELAQRQADLNKRIKELDDRRRLAKNDQEQEEIERELKRLRDEQQELLRDADELRERMQQPQNQRQMADSRRQLEQTRSDLQRASEALEAGQASRALTAGTRAQQRLEEMKEEFRRRSAGSFDEAVRDLQQDARELADRQRAIGQELEHPEAPADGGRPTLRDSDRREEVGQSLAEQQQRLKSLMDRMRDVVQQSEASEPLLSQKLYDAILESRKSQPDETLRMAQELLRRGFIKEGTEAEELARGAIERLEQGVNKAAESILGDELKTLERARAQVADLARALDDELAQSDPRATRSGERGAGNESEGQPGAAETASQPSQDNAERPQAGEGSKPGQQAGEGDRTGNGAGEQPRDQADRDEQQQGGRGSPSETGQGGEGSQSESSPQDGQQQAETPRGEQQGSGQQQGSGNEPGQQPSESRSPGQGGGQGQRSGNRNQGGGRAQPGAEDSPSQGAALANLFQTGGQETAGTNTGGPPLTGQDFTGWSDQLREVEEMLSLPELRAQAGAIRERARDVRREFKRHSKTPDWNLVRTEIYGP
ncbi:MAG: hypothetical protein U0992_25215, partial [Planctomycetaceae bacterium]